MKIGILGGGQLARMLALAGYPMGLKFCVLDPNAESCAAPVSELIEANYDESAALARLADCSDLISYEFENVPAESVHFLSQKKTVYPPPEALAIARNRRYEKRLFRQLNIDTAPYAEINSLADLERSLPEIGLPALIKTCTLGYDGKGQFLIHSLDQAQQAWQSIGQVPAVLEAYLSFDREVSLLVVRSPSGQIAYYPLTENFHQNGILRLSFPLFDDPMQKQAERYAEKIVQHLHYVGVLAIEFFQLGDRLLANEMAPRVHNSGHWSIEGAECSQFENHWRALLDLPLGATCLVAPSVMFNLIGELPAHLWQWDYPGLHWHLYDKSARPGRKIGHLTLRQVDADFLRYAHQIAANLNLQCQQSLTALGKQYIKSTASG